MKANNTFNVFCHYISACRLMNQLRTREDIYEWQQRRLRNFFDNTLSKSPFYRGYKYNDFQDIPIISKNEMMENFDEINTAELCKKEAFDIALKAEQTRNFSPELNGYTVGLSSGISGQRGLFVASATERQKWAGIMLAKTLGGKIWQRQKVALFLRANSNLYESLGTGRHIKFNYFDITQGIDLHISSLNKLQPTILTGPASILKHLAETQKNGTLQIQPAQILSGAEVLDPQDQSFIEDVFQIPVRQIYQCTEGFLGMTSFSGQLLLNEDYVLIEKEYIDATKKRFVPIITDFTRTTQPIVRYRLDDVLVEDPSNTSPFTALKAIDGRCDDVFYFRALSGEDIPIYADILRQTLVVSGVPYQDYQLIQKSPNLVECKMSPTLSPTDQSKIINAFKSLCKKIKCAPIDLKFLPYEVSPSAQKMRRIIRHQNFAEDKAA